MSKVNPTLCFSLIVAFVLGAISSLVASSAFGQDPVDLAKWRESSSRKAGKRQTLTIGKTEIGLVWVPAGEFNMGSPKSEPTRNPNENQIHVKLTRGFWALETETTQGLYQEVMGTNPSARKGKFLPVDNVSWDDATQFCEELTKRLPEGLTASLPTEAQWEYACRAGTKTAFWYGNSVNYGKTHCVEDHAGWATPVKSYPPNPWGLYETHGNVYEWVRDAYVESYAGEYGLGTAVDPESEDSDSAATRVCRGGGWSHSWGCSRSAYRRKTWSGDKGDYIGFRFILICE